MTLRTTMGMEPRIKQRYGFAASAFSRMLGVKSSMNDIHIKKFCEEWATWEVQAPLAGLDEVDQYFYYEYKNWRGI